MNLHTLVAVVLPFLTIPILGSEGWPSYAPATAAAPLAELKDNIKITKEVPPGPGAGQYWQAQNNNECPVVVNIRVRWMEGIESRQETYRVELLAGEKKTFFVTGWTSDVYETKVIWIGPGE